MSVQQFELASYFGQRRVLPLLISCAQVAVRMVADFTEYPHNYLPQTIQRAAEIVGLDKEGRWAETDAWERLVSFEQKTFAKTAARRK